MNPPSGIWDRNSAQKMHPGSNFPFISGKEHCDPELRTVGGTSSWLPEDTPPCLSEYNPKGKSSPKSGFRGWARSFPRWLSLFYTPQDSHVKP